MKTVYPQDQDRPDAQAAPAAPPHPVHADELLQNQLRRLHNTRARQRAARHPRIARPPM